MTEEETEEQEKEEEQLRGAEEERRETAMADAGTRFLVRQQPGDDAIIIIIIATPPQRKFCNENTYNLVADSLQFLAIAFFFREEESLLSSSPTTRICLVAELCIIRAPGDTSDVSCCASFVSLRDTSNMALPIWTNLFIFYRLITIIKHPHIFAFAYFSLSLG